MRITAKILITASYLLLCLLLVGSTCYLFANWNEISLGGKILGVILDICIIGGLDPLGTLKQLFKETKY